MSLTSASSEPNMVKIPSPYLRREDPGPENGNLEVFASDTDVVDASTNSSPPEDDSMPRGKKSLKSPVNGSDKGSGFMEDGLTNYENWPGMIDSDLDGDPVTSTQPAYPNFETGHSTLSADWLQILQEGNKRYALRDADRSTFRGSGFQDLDQSGDFCPNQKPEDLARPLKSKIRKIANVQNHDNGDYDDQTPKRQQPRTLSYEQGKKNGRSMYLRLKISSEGGIKKFKALTRKHLSSCEAADEVPQGGYRRSSSDSVYGGTKLPFIGRIGVTTRRLTVRGNEKTYDHPYRNSEDTYENLIGLRDGRGCRDCYDLGLECSLIDDCLSYPCNSCKEDDQDCIPIIPRNEKRPCEQCKRKRLQCLYTRDCDEESMAACDNCQNANVICISRPAKSYRIDDVLASISKGGTCSKATTKTQCPFCTKCRKNKIRNSDGSENQICRKCLIGTPGGTREASLESVKAEKKRKPLPKKRVIKTRARLHTSSNSNSNSFKQGKGLTRKKKLHEKSRAQKINFKFDSDLECGKPKFSASIPGGKTMHITTSYCHPIQFNWIPPPPLSPSSSEIKPSPFPCHFCTDPGLPYAIAGLGSKLVEVMQWEYDPTAGYEELGGGWVEAGEEGTRLCIQCTMERVLICLCTDHMIRPIKGLDPRNFDFESALQSLINQILNRGKPDNEKTAGNGADASGVKWCSICIEPAFFECCVRPPFTTSGRETSPSDDIGCGLLLCEVCAFRMTGWNQHRRSPPGRPTPPASGEEPVKTIVTLDEHINAASKDMFHYCDGLRADVCFLKADSELIRRQGAGGGDAVGDGGNEQKMDVDEDQAYDGFQDRGLKKRNWGMGSPIDLT